MTTEQNLNEQDLQIQDKKTKLEQVRVIIKNSFNPGSYDYNEGFQSYDRANPLSARSTSDLLDALARNERIELDAKVLVASKDGRASTKSISKEAFLKAFKEDAGNNVKLTESDFARDSFGASSVGQDFTPLLGGPFYKNLYFYQDYIRMHADAFYAYHSDPFANAVIKITRDFVLGTGFEVSCDMDDPKGKMAMAVWKAFERANELHEQIDQACTELGIYGEIMFWKLPGREKYITYQLGQNQTAPTGIIPRVRLLDPSNLVEIVTYPEDITRKLFYVWLNPTQYQIYTGGIGTEAPPEQTQPTLKFIYRQIPADQILHYKVNSVSNEKRGRSDLYPIFSYLKRMRDSINYSLIALQKTSAYSIDTQIDGDQTDIDNYVRAQAALGTIPQAGSEFVHSTKVTRQYLGNSKASGSVSNAFEWCLSAIATGVQIPVSYFATHLSGGQTRASALVATEPVAKKFEKRREVIKRIIKDLWDYAMQEAGLEAIDCDIIFPELITQDRSQKLKDLLLMQQNRWIKPERAASIAAKEMGIKDYDYNAEIEDMQEQLPEIPAPLTNPGKVSATAPMQLPEQQDTDVAALTSKDKEEVKQNDQNPG